MAMNDKERIIALGGPTQVARILQFDLSKGGAQRVQNWMSRGIPAAVKVKWPDLFLAEVPVHGQEAS